jgi:pimeloyl-ACP methyl ester carboxylesterase
MSGLIIALAAKESPQTFGNLAVLEGVGTNSLVLRQKYPDPEQRKRAYIRRFAHVVAPPHNASPLAQAHAGTAIAAQVARDIWPLSEHRFGRQFAIAADAVEGASYDTIPILLDHAKLGHKVLLINGEKDPLVPDAEVRESVEEHLRSRGENLRQINLEIFDTENAHAYMGFKAGQRHLQAASMALGLAETKQRANRLAELQVSQETA